MTAFSQPRGVQLYIFMFSLAGGYLEDRIDLVDLRIRGVLIGVVHRGDRRAGPEQSGELILIRADVVI